jgi:dipeptidyl aminopeptidase/acylaminoacyl peptidase
LRSEGVPSRLGRPFLPAPSLVYRFGEIRVDPSSARVFRGDRPVAVEPKAFDVLRFLLENPGRLVEKQELLDAVWRDAAVTENAMTRVVAQLRKTLGDDAKQARYIDPEGPSDIWLLELEGGRAKKSRPFLATPADEKEPSFSPDGKFLVFQTNASGRSEIEIASLATGQRFRASTEGGREPVWTRGGREIVYRNGTQFFALAVAPGEAPELSYPTALFDSGFLTHVHRNYDVTPDGERLLGVRLEGLEPHDAVQLALNWPGKLRSR